MDAMEIITLLTGIALILGAASTLVLARELGRTRLRALGSVGPVLVGIVLLGQLAFVGFPPGVDQNVAVAFCGVAGCATGPQPTPTATSTRHIVHVTHTPTHPVKSPTATPTRPGPTGGHTHPTPTPTRPTTHPTPTPTRPAVRPTPTPTHPAPQPTYIGSHYTWTATMTGAYHATQYYNSNDGITYYTPAGTHYQIVDLKLTNDASSSQSVSGHNLSMRDSNGTHYGEANATHPDDVAVVPAGGTVYSESAFVVPDTQCTFYLSFIYSGYTQASWTIHSTYSSPYGSC